MFQGLGQLPLITTVTGGIVMLHEENCVVRIEMLHLRVYMPCQARWLLCQSCYNYWFCIQILRNHLGEKGTVPSPKGNRTGHAKFKYYLSSNEAGRIQLANVRAANYNFQKSS